MKVVPTWKKFEKRWSTLLVVSNACIVPINQAVRMFYTISFCVFWEGTCHCLDNSSDAVYGDAIHSTNLEGIKERCVSTTERLSGTPLRCAIRQSRHLFVIIWTKVPGTVCFNDEGKRFLKTEVLCHLSALYGGADKSLARPGRKRAMTTEDVDVHISYL